MHKEALAHAPVFFSRCPALKRAPTTSYSPHRLCGFCGTTHVRPTVRHLDGGIIVVINMMFQIIKIILAIIGIIFGGIFILGMLIDGAAWRFLMGLALLGPAVWWFVTKPGQRRWKAVIPLALLSFFAGVGIAPDTEPEQPAAAVMATPSSSSTPTTTKKTTTSRPTTTSRTTTSQTTTATTTSAPPTTSTVVSETQVVSENHTDHYVRDPEPAPVIVPEPEYPPAPAPEPETAPAQNVYYPNCKAAKAAGAAPLYQGEPGYRAGLDRDQDGVACER